MSQDIRPVTVIGGLVVAGVILGFLANSLQNHGETTKPLLLSERLQPVGQTNVAAEPTTKTAVVADSGGSSSSERTGRQVVEQVCSDCHTSGVMGAPKIGDKKEWAPRAKKGLDTLAEHALQGFGKMPPQKSVVSAAEAHAAVKYMVEEKTGIKLK